MRHLLAANVRAHARRYSATALAIAISAAFVVVCLALGNGMVGSFSAQVTGQFTGAATVISEDMSWYDSESESPIPDLKAVADTVRTVNGVTDVALDYSGFVELHHQGQRLPRPVSTAHPEPFQQPTLTSGTLPGSASEIVIDANAAQILNIAVGQSVDLMRYLPDGMSEPLTLTVSGIAEAPAFGMSSLLLSEDGLAAASPDSVPYRILVSAGHANPDAAIQESVTRAVVAALDGQEGLWIATADQAIAAQLENDQMSEASLFAALLLFPVIAAAVASIVVATTFQVIMTQRRRELALLRAVGARTAQVRGLVIREAMLVGATSALLGVLSGAAIGTAILIGTGINDVPLAFASAWAPLPLVATWAAGTLLAVLVALRPAFAVGQLSPMAALSPVEDTPEARSSRAGGRFLMGLSIVVLVLSLAGMVWGAFIAPKGMEAFLVALLCGVICLVAAMLVCAAVLPPLASALGRLHGSVVTQMARGNVQRSAGRSGATAVAIAIGVTLMTMMSVGAASMQMTLTREVDTQRPFDLAVSTLDAAISDEAVAEIAQTPGVAASLPVYRASGTVSLAGGATRQDGEVGQHDESSVLASDMVLRGEPDLNPVAHSEVSVLPDGVVVISAVLFDTEVTDGDILHVCADGGRCLDLPARVSENQGLVVADVSATTLAELTPTPVVGEVLIKLEDGADVDTVQTALAGIDPTLNIFGAAAERAKYTQMINIALATVVGMLAVSVLVALVGVTNTLSLSVHERTRENGLLRALGMKRGTMRAMLAIEALLLAAAATVVGIGLGAFFGLIGLYAFPIEVEVVHYVFPWQIVAAMAALSLLAALLASWLPGRRAAQTSPVEALATV